MKQSSNGEINLLDLTQFDLGSKVGNSMRECKARIVKDMRDINFHILPKTAAVKPK